MSDSKVQFTVFIEHEALPGHFRRQVRYTPIKAATEAEAIQIGKIMAIEQGYKLAQPDDPEASCTFAIQHGSRKEYPIEIDLLTWGEDPEHKVDFNQPSYCSSSINNNNWTEGEEVKKYGKRVKNYSFWEDVYASPVIQAAGYKLEWCWVNGEADSFGPLSRALTVSKDGIFYEFTYG